MIISTNITRNKKTTTPTTSQMVNSEPAIQEISNVVEAEVHLSEGEHTLVEPVDENVEVPTEDTINFSEVIEEPELARPKEQEVEPVQEQPKEEQIEETPKKKASSKKK